MKFRSLVVAIVLSLTTQAAFAAITIDAPKRSPKTGEMGSAQLIDESSRKLELLGVIFPDSNGATGVPSGKFVDGKISQVTGKKEPSRYLLANGKEVPMVSLASIDMSTHALKPLVLPAASMTLVGDVTGLASANTVATVGGKTASAVATSVAYTLAEKGIVAVADKPSGGSVGTAATTVDIAKLLNVTQTTAAQTLTLPSPTDAASAKVLYVYNAGSASFTLLGATVSAGAAQGALWNGSAWIAL